MADHYIKHDCAFYHINGCVSFHSYAPCMFMAFSTFFNAYEVFIASTKQKVYTFYGFPSRYLNRLIDKVLNCTAQRKQMGNVTVHKVKNSYTIHFCF